MIKKRYLFLIIVICLFTISAVSAEEVSNETNVGVNSYDSGLMAESVDGSNLLTESDGSFSELQNLVNNNNVVNLTKDYAASGSEGRVLISKSVTINGNGHTIDANGKSGIFHITEGYIILNNLTLKNGNGDNGGALTIHENAKSLTLNQVKFLNNHAEYSGGAIYYDGPNALDYTRLTDCYFEGNSAKLFGGAVYHNAKEDIRINNCIFKSNKCEEGSTRQGGAIFSRTRTYIDGCAFIDNLGFDEGGAIYSTKYLDIIYSNFTNNRVNVDYGGVIIRHHGGAIYSTGAIYTIGCNFNNNIAKNYGGAIYSTQPIDIINCNFTNNNATKDYGGAIYCLDNVNIENSIFNNNHGDVHGGAIYSKKSVEAKDSRFEKNSVIESYGPELRSGGAIRALENVKVINSYFSDSSVTEYGGAIHASSVTAVSSYFVSNRANKNGGAVYAEDYVEVENSYFEGNFANKDGGAIYCEQSVITKNTTFESNRLGHIIGFKSYGGAIYAKEDVKVDSSRFYNNEATDPGGAIYSDSVTWVASPSYFIGNHLTTRQDGGAIYTNKFTTDVKYGVFIENGVGTKDCGYGKGGAIYINKENHITFSQCVFQNNYAKKGSAIYLDSRSSTLSVKDNIFIADGSYQQQPVYNSGTYGEIKNNWYRSLDPNFENMFKEWKLFGDESHSDSDYLVAVLTLSETPRVGQTYNLTFKFIPIYSEEPTGELFGWSVKFNADNNASISNYKIGTNTVTAEIIFNNEGVTNISAEIFGEILKLSYNPTKENVTMNITAPEISWGENATAEIIFTPNTATGTVTVGNISSTIVNGTATVIIPNLPVGNNTLSVEYSGDGVFKNMSTSVVIVVNRKDLNISASAIPIYVGDNATVVVTGLEDATGNVTVTIGDNNWSGEITNGTASIIVPGLTANGTANVTYLGDNNHNNASTTVDIIVNNAPKMNLTNMVASAESIHAPDDAVVIVTGLENATGNVTVTIGDKNWFDEITNGTASVIVTGLTSNVTANVSYVGDYRYNNASTTVDILVYPPIYVWYVDGNRNSSGNGTSKETAFKTLREAVNKAPDGSTIYIMPGTYVGYDNVGLFIDQNLSLVNYGAGEVIFDAQGLCRILTVNTESINITGLTFKNGKEEYVGGAIFFNQTLNNSIINATFINNTVMDGVGGAIAFYSGINNSVINSVFINNHVIDHDGGAIYFNGDLNNVTIGGTYNNNSAEDDGGVFYFYGNSTDVILSGDYTNNMADDGAVIFSEGNIVNSIISGNYINNTAETNINFIFIASNVNMSGNYVNNTAFNGGVIYVLDGENDSIVHDSIFINNSVDDEPIILDVIGSISVVNCWFGNNATNYNATPNVSQNVTLINWLFLNATANPAELKINETSEITFKLYSYNISEEISEYDASEMNIKLDLNQTQGTLSKDSVLINEPVMYNCTGEGFASVTGKFETALYTIILAKAPTEIIVNKTDVTLNVSDSVSAGATLVPAGAGNLTYTSSNETVAVVEDGKIRGIKEGNATITISFEGNEYYAAAEDQTITVTVTLNDASVSADDMELKVGENGTISYTTSPPGLNVTFVPDDSGVVSVANNGTVTALKEGTAQITINVGDNKKYALNSTVITVTVSKISTEINVEKANVTLNALDSVDANATLTPADAGNLTYTSSDENVVQVNDGKIIAAGKGTATITVSFNGTDKYAAAESKTIEVTVNINDASVTAKDITLTVGENATIDATTTPEGLTIDYVVDDSGVVTVENGVVTAVKGGTAEITLTVGDNKTYTINSTTITVTVNKIDTSIEVENKTLELYVDEEGHIVATLNPDGGDLNFTSSDESVVTVDNFGDFNAVAEGTATITISFAGDDKYNAAENVTVTVKVSKIDTSIEFNYDTINLKVHNETIVIATLSPAEAGNVTYTSSNPSVVTVDEDGNVKAVGAGNATITASFAGNNKYNAAENVTVSVVVSKIDTKITVDTESLDLNVGNETAVKGTLTPAEAGNVSYMSNDTSVVTVDENTGKVKAVGAGNATIIVFYDGNADYNMADDVTITVTVSKIDTSIAVKDKVDMKIGDSVNLNATLTPAEAGNITYTSKNPSVVTVDKKGNVVAVSEGNATVTVSFEGNDMYLPSNATVTVNVELKDASVVADPDSLDLLVGEEGKFYTETTPEDLDIEVSSSNESVATVKLVNRVPTVTAVGEGTAVITVTINEDKYVKNSTTVAVTVVKIPTEILIQNHTLDMKVDDVADPVVSLMPSNAGNLSFKVSDTNVILVNGHGVVKAVGEGTATVTVSFKGNDKYLPSNATITVTVSKIPTEISVDPASLNLIVGNESAIAATLTPADAGNVTFTSSDDSVVTVDDKGNVVAVGEGNATVTVSFAGDDKYAAAENVTVSVFVAPKPKENATISIDAPSEATEGDNVTVTVNLPEDATGTVTIGNEVVPVKNGTASAVLTNLPVGNTTVPITYSGDDKYNPIETEVNITVKEDTSDIISAPDVTKYFSGPERFVVTVTDSKGAPLENKSVTIVINGVPYTRKTNENGTASIPLGLNSGVYNVTVTMDNKTINSAVTILPTVNGTDVVKMYRNGTQYYATFRDSQGNYLNDGETVRFNINGVMYDRKVSGKEGLAKLNINLEAGKYVITAINPVTGETAANNITVLSRFTENEDLTKYYRNSSQYTVKVLGNDGKAVGAGETVRFNINGVFYERQTDANGVAKLNINLQPGDYIITAEYKGEMVSNNIKVLPVLGAKDIAMKYRDGTQFKATLVDGQGKPYAGQTVTFNINGVFYNRATDSTGTAKLNINLMPGEYIITSSYNGASIANKITIRG